MMEIACERAADIRVITLEGNFDTAAAYTHEKELVAYGDCSIVINMEDMAFIASSGLRVLLRMARACKESESLLVLCHVNDLVFEILAMTGFNKILDIAKDEVSAVYRIKDQRME